MSKQAETEGMTYCPRSRGWFPSMEAHLNEMHLKVYPECGGKTTRVRSPRRLAKSRVL